jgi:hypothetical protein
MNIPFGLVNAVQSRQVVLFAGAGISQIALNVSGRSLKEALGADIRKNYSDYDVTERTFEDVCDEWSALNDKVGLVFRIAELIPKNATPLPSHLVAVEAFRFIITTNWDLLFEEAYRTAMPHYHRIVAESDVPGFNFDQHNLLKIHGSVDQPTSMVATTEDYEAYPDTHSGMLRCVADLVSNNTVLFVGYGIRDEHVRRLLAFVRRTRGQWSRRAYAIGFYDSVRTRALDRRNIEVLPYDAADVLPEIVRRAKT